MNTARAMLRSEAPVSVLMVLAAPVAAAGPVEVVVLVALVAAVVVLMPVG
jgi:hypothetical protein